jgi:hypothetical protein
METEKLHDDLPEDIPLDDIEIELIDLVLGQEACHLHSAA